MTRLSGSRSRKQSTQIKTPVRRPEPAANSIAPNVEVSETEIQSFGSVSQVTGGSGSLSYFSLQLTNSSSNRLTYIIGDPNGIVESAFAPAVAYSQPISNTISYAAILASLVSGALNITGINYSVTTSANQFNNPFQFVSADIDGSSHSQPVGVALAKRNNQFNANLLTLKFRRCILDDLHALRLQVDPGESVGLDFFVGAAANRRAM